MKKLDSKPAITNRTIWIGSIILILIIGVPQGFFFYHLAQYGWSTDPEQWGQYADFAGGVANPLLAVVNIVILVWLTNTVQKIEHERTERIAKEDVEREVSAIEREKEKQAEISALEDKRNQSMIDTQKMITLTKMRDRAVDRYRSQMPQFNAEDTVEDRIAKLNEIRTNVVLFKENTSHLFNDLFEPGNILLEAHKLIFFSAANLIAHLNKAKEASSEESFQLFHKVASAQLDFIAKMNKFILTEMSIPHLS
ncbi:MAG: hypothetical protein K0R51_1200 [Cytophagaceae bacterium]|jgi:hypothetical protein|nr:hypothetical protein [Cytophagaceae bacterium]